MKEESEPEVKELMVNNLIQEKKETEEIKPDVEEKIDIPVVEEMPEEK